jgi:hypothetical protein
MKRSFRRRRGRYGAGTGRIGRRDAVEEELFLALAYERMAALHEEPGEVALAARYYQLQAWRRASLPERARDSDTIAGANE